MSMILNSRDHPSQTLLLDRQANHDEFSALWHKVSAQNPKGSATTRAEDSVGQSPLAVPFVDPPPESKYAVTEFRRGRLAEQIEIANKRLPQFARVRTGVRQNQAGAAQFAKFLGGVQKVLHVDRDRDRKAHKKLVRARRLIRMSSAPARASAAERVGTPAQFKRFVKSVKKKLQRGLGRYREARKTLARTRQILRHARSPATHSNGTNCGETCQIRRKVRMVERKAKRKVARVENREIRFKRRAKAPSVATKKHMEKHAKQHANQVVKERSAKVSDAKEEVQKAKRSKSLRQAQKRVHLARLMSDTKPHIAPKHVGVVNWPKWRKNVADGKSYQALSPKMKKLFHAYNEQLERDLLPKMSGPQKHHDATRSVVKHLLSSSIKQATKTAQHRNIRKAKRVAKRVEEHQRNKESASRKLDRQLKRRHRQAKRQKAVPKN